MPKRHSALIPLSHDHHHGLALALRCRKHALGQLNPGDRVSMAACVAEASRFFNENLTPHFEAEETILFPLMAAHEECRELVSQLEDEHREFRKMVTRSAEGSDPRKFLFDFGDLLEQHIRAEERRLFAAFEILLPEVEAEGAGREIKRLLDAGKPASRADTP